MPKPSENLKTNIKVLYLNPIGFSTYDKLFAKMVTEYKYPFTDAYVGSLNPETVPHLLSNLEYRTYETFIELDTIKAARYCAKNEFDGLAIGCFYDPALDAAREISDTCIVVAPCQSSCQIAASISNRFSIIIGRNKWEDQMRQTVYNYGYKDYLASFQSVGLSVEDFQKDVVETKRLLTEQSCLAIELFKAESIILGCTLEVGFFKELSDKLTEKYSKYIPVIDSSIAAFKAAENAAILSKIGFSNSRVHGMEPPSEEQMSAFEILQEDYKLGNTIHIPATLSGSSQETDNETLNTID